MEEDTIAAISTPLGEGAIGIVRLSGPEAIPIVERLFKGRDTLSEAASHTIHYGHIIDPRDSSTVDEVLISVMRAPRTYTKEDVVEINCHGGIIPLRRVLELVIREGARLAQPGEFTKRAFLNGRIDLAQAEAVIELIRARTELGSRVALSHLKGTLSKAIGEVRDEIVGIVAAIEAAIDFPEDDVGDVDIGGTREELMRLLGRLEDLLATADSGRILREGIKTAIIGKPNVGKSSLLNLLLRESRAIVTEIPGTTRDLIEEVMNIRGVPLILVDTAGIRETRELVERLGIERTLEALAEAELILYVVDGSTELTDEDYGIIAKIAGKDVIVVLNKIDLPPLTTKEELGHIFRERGKEFPIVGVSAKMEWGLEELENAILDEVFKGKIIAGDDSPLIMNPRQKDIMERAIARVREAIEGIDGGMPADLVALDLKSAGRILGEITGEVLDDEVVERIFSQFCVGK